MAWTDELEDEIRHRQEELSKKDALRLLRRTVFEEQGPHFFSALESQLRMAIESLAQRNAEVKAVILDPSDGRRSFRLRNPELRPSVKVEVHLHSADIIVSVHQRPSATDPESETGNCRIDFALDANDRLALCAGCKPVDIDEVAKIILRPALGL